MGFLFGSFPLLDEVVVVPLHYALCRRLAKMRGVPVAKLPWKQLERIIWFGAGARTALGLSMAPIPLAGAVGNWVTAYALTEFLAQYLDDAIAHPDEPPPEITMARIRELFERARRREPPASDVVSG